MRSLLRSLFPARGRRSRSPPAPNSRLDGQEGRRRRSGVLVHGEESWRRRRGGGAETLGR